MGWTANCSSIQRTLTTNAFTAKKLSESTRFNANKHYLTVTEIGESQRPAWSRDDSGTFFTGRDDSSIAWKIEGRLDPTGVDLTDFKTVYIQVS